MDFKPEGLSREGALRSLLSGLLHRPAQGAWERLEAPLGQRSAAATYFLMDPDPAEGPEGGVERFVCDTLRHMLANLTGQSVQRDVQYVGEVRGRISWAATLRARSARDFNPGSFVCRRVRQQYDTEENQLLKYTLIKLHWCLQQVPDSLRNGFCCFPESDTFQIESTPDRLGRIEDSILNFQRDIRFRQITQIQEVENRHLVKAETSRIEDYGHAARLYRSFKRAVLSPDWGQISLSGRRSLPLPRSSDSDRGTWMDLGAEILRSMI